MIVFRETSDSNAENAEVVRFDLTTVAYQRYGIHRKPQVKYFDFGLDFDVQRPVSLQFLKKDLLFHLELNQNRHFA